MPIIRPAATPTVWIAPSNLLDKPAASHLCVLVSLTSRSKEMHSLDPRGLLTFAVSGIGLFALSWLVVRSGVFASGLRYLGCLLAALSVTLYIGRLIVLAPENPLILVPALLAGFVVCPIWYVWFGVALRKAGRQATWPETQARAAALASPSGELSWRVYIITKIAHRLTVSAVSSPLLGPE